MFFSVRNDFFATRPTRVQKNVALPKKMKVVCRHTFPFSWTDAYRSLLLRMMRSDESFQSTRLGFSNGALRYRIDRFVPELLATISGMKSVQYVEKITVDRASKKMTLVSEQWENNPLLLDVKTEYTEGENGQAVAMSVVTLNISIPAIVLNQAEALVHQLFAQEMEEQEKEITGVKKN